MNKENFMSLSSDSDNKFSEDNSESVFAFSDETYLKKKELSAKQLQPSENRVYKALAFDKC